jgi:hypothetical protein
VGANQPSSAARTGSIPKNPTSHAPALMAFMVGLIGRWKEGPDQKFSVRYEVNFKGQVCHALIFTVQGRQIRIDDHVFVVGDQTALEETLGKTIVEAIKREASRR